jgi:hypothetical protein
LTPARGLSWAFRIVHRAGNFVGHHAFLALQLFALRQGSCVRGVEDRHGEVGRQILSHLLEGTRQLAR